MSQTAWSFSINNLYPHIVDLISHASADFIHCIFLSFLLWTQNIIGIRKRWKAKITKYIWNDLLVKLSENTEVWICRQCSFSYQCFISGYMGDRLSYTSDGAEPMESPPPKLTDQQPRVQPEHQPKARRQLQSYENTG